MAVLNRVAILETAYELGLLQISIMSLECSWCDTVPSLLTGYDCTRINRSLVLGKVSFLATNFISIFN